MGCASSHDATGVSSPRARYAQHQPSAPSTSADSHDSAMSTSSDDGHLAREP
eukprot:CAMPEP_0174829990 /NCGR_PEP_ID=MMETSP1114-20130205/2275_1 /TAXON_ID=312471 /ORGANISM="Neobodo designis, Strain CCAP 1951/1" /LENGTH=51 /DNA_ID=CAMNT_0016063771 /DNA_START=76 /DNA_END=228 /DNA_ORIENTATION=+